MKKKTKRSRKIRDQRKVDLNSDLFYRLNPAVFLYSQIQRSIKHAQNMIEELRGRGFKIEENLNVKCKALDKPPTIDQESMSNYKPLKLSRDKR